LTLIPVRDKKKKKLDNTWCF